MKDKPVILIAPLDWGLGHTTRCIPIVRHLLNAGCEVIIACNPEQKVVFEAEFDDIHYRFLKGYSLRFGNNRLLTILNILLQIPKILAAIRHEKKWLDDFLRHNPVNAVIADNRYGMFSVRIPCIFITHQLTIKSPFGTPGNTLLRSLNYRLIKKFSACWVPDYKGSENLAGELSHPKKMPPIPVRYLGILSRISKLPGQNKNQLLIILSGPEPQRSIFEQILLQQLKAYPQQAILVRGLPAKNDTDTSDDPALRIYNHLPAVKLSQAINDSAFIISRPGYSTIMDVARLEKKCIFVPTPGQSEQEYLAGYLSGKKFCVSYSQKTFCLKKALHEAARLLPFSPVTAGPYPYKNIIDEFIRSLTTY